LRQQLAVMNQSVKRPKLLHRDRVFWTWLRVGCPSALIAATAKSDGIVTKWQFGASLPPINRLDVGLELIGSLCLTRENRLDR
jgi:hypothetical protein